MGDWVSVTIIRQGPFDVSSNRPRPRESTPILLRRLNRFDPCSTEGSEENFEHKAAKATKAYGGLSFRDTYSVGPSASPPIVLVLEV